MSKLIVFAIIIGQALGFCLCIVFTFAVPELKLDQTDSDTVIRNLLAMVTSFVFSIGLINYFVASVFWCCICISTASRSVADSLFDFFAVNFFRITCFLSACYFFWSVHPVLRGTEPIVKLVLSFLNYGYCFMIVNGWQKIIRPTYVLPNLSRDSQDESVINRWTNENFALKLKYHNFNIRFCKIL